MGDFAITVTIDPPPETVTLEHVLAIGVAAHGRT